MSKIPTNSAVSSFVLALTLFGVMSCEVAPVQEPAQPAAAGAPAAEAPPAAKDVPAQPATQQAAPVPAPALAARPAAPKPPAKKQPDLSAIFLGSDGRMAGTGDPNNLVSEAYRLGTGDHPQALSVPGLPKDKFGLIDWIAMVDQEVIKPVGSLQPGAPDLPPLDMNVLIKAKGDFVNNVLFRHKTHTYWLSCEICHNGIFIMAKGQNKMSMVGISEGKWCGRCHGKVSFPLTDCVRCHSQPKQSPPTEGVKQG